MKEFYLQNKKIVLSAIALFLLCTALILLFLTFDVQGKVEVHGIKELYGPDYIEKEYTLREHYFDYCSLLDSYEYGNAPTSFLYSLYASIALSVAYLVAQIFILPKGKKESAPLRFAPLVLAILALTTAILFLLYQGSSWIQVEWEEIDFGLFRERMIQPHYNFIPPAILCLLAFFINTAIFAIPFLSKKAVSEKGNSEDLKNDDATTDTPVLNEADQIKKYKELLDVGAISQEEYDAKKKELLGL